MVEVKTEIRKALAEELEDKVAVIGVTDEDIATSAIPTGNVLTSTNFIKLLPNISSGVGQYNFRDGNEIRLKELDIKMLLNFALSDLSTATNEDAGVGVRVMILRQKDQNSQTGALSDFQGDKLLENGAIVTPGPSSFAGNTFNLVQHINREQFSVRYDKVFYLDATYRQASGGATTVSQTFLPPKTVVMQKKLRFGKNGLKLTFGNKASDEPTNFPYFMVLGVASTVSNSVPSNDLIRYSYSSNARYTDA
ncbi:MULTISPECIES: hypothetical protein [Pseudomonadota]